ncbi:MAG: hypothetical protein K2G99_04280, partial [Desulfovibrio sp.]|nr:hypothetical protein [Desulfovibrio sp.]
MRCARRGALVLCALFLCACGGSGQEPQQGGGSAASPEAEKRSLEATVEAASRILQETPRLKVVPTIHVRPVERDLSPEALGLYAYLRAVRAILDEDEAALLEAALVAAEASSGRGAGKDAEATGPAPGAPETPAWPEAQAAATTVSPAAPQAAAAGLPDQNLPDPNLPDQVWPTQIWLDGGVWLMSRKSPNAVPYLEQAIKAQPEDISLNLLLAEALGEHGMAGRGADLMRAYLARHPGTLDARLELALLLVKEHQFVEAEKLLTDIPAKERTPLVDYY